MSVPIPLRGDFKASQLRGLAKKTKDGPQARRLLTLAAIYDGATRTEAAKIGAVGLQIIRDWVLRFNARGPDGLLDGKPPGQPRVAKKLKLQERRAVIPSRRSLAACRPLGFLGRSRTPSRIGGHTRGTYGVGTYPGLHDWDGGP